MSARPGFASNHLLIPMVWLTAVFLMTHQSRLTAAPRSEPGSGWMIYVVNDVCSDMTWGNSEAGSFRNMADIVKAHLDRMTVTDSEPGFNRNRFTATTTNEILSFLEKYPDRRDELASRVRSGRLMLGPFLCNTDWGFLGVEGFLRGLYPAKRLAREWGVALDAGVHSELPSFPWGIASLLTGSGIRWCCKPFLNYDAEFDKLENPPVFVYEGPDGSRLDVVMDPWASNRFNYTQGAALLKDTASIRALWIPHYADTSAHYPFKRILAEGTHGDLYANSVEAVPKFSDAVIECNSRAGDRPLVVNATFKMFADAVDSLRSAGPVLKTVRGDFGYSWELWPVALAKYAAMAREGERRLVAAEALLAAFRSGRAAGWADIRRRRERAEWCLAMMSEHAWNGTDDANRRLNASLRRRWGMELLSLTDSLIADGWKEAAMDDKKGITVYNPAGFKRSGPVRLPVPEKGFSPSRFPGLPPGIPVQRLVEDGGEYLAFSSPEIPGYGFTVVSGSKKDRGDRSLAAGPGMLESPFYKLLVDSTDGGIRSLVYKPAGWDLVSNGGSFCRSAYDGKSLKGISTEIVASGPVLARLRITGRADGLVVTNEVTVYADFDRVDFDLRVHKPASLEKPFCQYFPAKGRIRIETTGAVIRPGARASGSGDMLPGAGLWRYPVQGFLDVSSDDGPGLTLVALDAFCYRPDLGEATFEALGCDHNPKEVMHDQNGETEFRFRYSLKARTNGSWDGPGAFAFSRSVAFPLMAAIGSITRPAACRVSVDPSRAVATCFKPADGAASDARVLRVWETAGSEEPLKIRIEGFRGAVLCNLLEDEGDATAIEGGFVSLPVRKNGFASVKLLK
jgi:hypothetical protein